ncbi:MAG: peptide ABC transporter substrate-binding protein [Spirochaetales bacterium]
MIRILLALWFLLLPALFWAEGSPTLRVNFGDSPISNDPAQGQTSLEAQVLSALYEGVLTYDPVTLKPAPGAAQKWEFAPGNMGLTLTLRPGLTYEDGTPLTSDDFLQSWLRLLNPALGAPFASLLDPIEGVQAWREGKLKDVSKLGIQTPAPDKIVLKFHEPAPQMASILSHYSFVPLAKSWRSQKQPAGVYPPSNGPYRLLSHSLASEGSPARWELVKNDKYWDASSVKIDNLEFTFRDDKEQVTKEFKDGQYAWLADVIDLSATINGRMVSATPLFGTSFFFFESTKAPWSDARIRQALIKLLPLEELRKNYLQPTSVLVPWFEGYPKVEPLKADKESALSDLAAAGFPNGDGLPPVRIVVPEGSDSQFFTDFFTKSWADLHLSVAAVEVKGNYYDQLAGQDATLGYFSWIGDFLDPVTFLYLWKGGSSLNSFHFQNADYDRLLVQSAKETKSEDRLKDLGKAEEFLLQQGLLIPLSHTPGFSLIDLQQVGGWYANPLDLHPFKSLYWKPLPSVKNTVRFDLR